MRRKIEKLKASGRYSNELITRVVSTSVHTKNALKLKSLEAARAKVAAAKAAAAAAAAAAANEAAKGAKKGKKKGSSPQDIAATFELATRKGSGATDGVSSASPEQVGDLL